VSNKNKIEAGFWLMYCSTLFLYFSFFVWAEFLLWVITIAMGILIFVQDGIRPLIHYRARNVGAKEFANTAWTNALAVARIGFVYGLTFKCMRRSGHSELMVVVFLCISLLLVVAIIRWLGLERQDARRQFKPILILWALVVITMQISELSLVLWQYRKYPAFIQTFECYQLDPQNPVLRDQVKLEHMRIVLNAAEFEQYERLQRRTIQYPNQW
jgi:uncharacterized membrane protein YidH (DUF202 family)